MKKEIDAPVSKQNTYLLEDAQDNLQKNIQQHKWKEALICAQDIRIILRSIQLADLAQVERASRGTT